MDLITKAYQDLRELIIWGRLAPGSRIMESEVSKRLGVSRTPVRSALQRLQQEGYVLSENGKKQVRLSVAPLTRRDAREVFDIVGAVEGLAARLAAGLGERERRHLAEDLQHLDQALLKAAAREQPDPNRIFDIYTRFHRTYVEAGSGPRLLALHNAIKPQADRYRRLYSSYVVDKVRASVDEHEAITGAIEAADGEAARRAVQVNWRNAAKRLEKVIATLGERGSW